jgi:hypothetical protein
MPSAHVFGLIRPFPHPLFRAAIMKPLRGSPSPAREMTMIVKIYSRAAGESLLSSGGLKSSRSRRRRARNFKLCRVSHSGRMESEFTARANVFKGEKSALETRRPCPLYFFRPLVMPLHGALFFPHETSLMRSRRRAPKHDIRL